MSYPKPYGNFSPFVDNDFKHVPKTLCFLLLFILDRQNTFFYDLVSVINIFLYIVICFILFIMPDRVNRLYNKDINLYIA